MPHWVGNGTPSSPSCIAMGVNRVGEAAQLISHPGQEMARFCLLSDFSLLMPKSKLSVRSRSVLAKKNVCRVSGSAQT